MAKWGCNHEVGTIEAMGFFLINSAAHLGELAALNASEILALAIKVEGANPRFPRRCRIRLIQIATPTHQFLIDTTKVDPRESLRAPFHSNRLLKVMANGKPILKQFFHHYDIEIRHIFCVALAVRLLGMGNRGEQAQIEAEIAAAFGGEHRGSPSAIDWNGPLNEDLIQIAAEETKGLLDLHEVLAEKIKTLKLRKVATLEFRTVMPVAAMELKGIFADQHQLGEVAEDLRQKCQTLEIEVLKHLRSPDTLPSVSILNLNSPEQVRQALIEKGIQVPDTSESRLRPLAEQYPFIQRFLMFRHYGKLLSFVETQLRDSVMPESGRIHAHYDQIASPSGRFACADPSIQQVPRENSLRACIKPEPGYIYLIADYSQVELRIAAGISSDELMLQALRDGRDLHRLTAALTMGKKEDQVSKQERQAAKAINFGLIYAMGSEGLRLSARSSYGVEMTPDQASRFRNRYFESYRGIQAWQRALEAEGRSRGYIRTAAGRIRSYRGETMRVTELLNFPIQGTAAEGLKSALCIFWEKTRTQRLDAVVVALIHDEIIVEVKTEHADMAARLLETSMVEGIAWLVPGVPFEVDIAWGKSWADK